MTDTMTGTMTDMRDAGKVAALFEKAAGIMLEQPHRKGASVRLPARGRLLATGDLHDNPIHLQKIIALARLDRSTDHHVIFHEMIHGEHLVNGVDLSHRMLARVAELVTKHPAQVHPLLANHEIAQLTGRGVSKGAGNSVELFNDGLEYVFNDEWKMVSDAISVFIRAMPLVLLSESGLCCAHSMPNGKLMEKFDCAVIDRALEEADFARNEGSAYLLTWGRAYTPESLETIAKAWNVSLFVLGHRHVETGVEVQGRSVVILNSDHEFGTVLPVDLANLPDADAAMMQGIPLRAV